MSLKVRGGRKASCSCHSRISQRSDRPEASQLCRSLLQGDGASDLPLLASNPLLAYHSVLRDGAAIALESFACLSLRSSDGVSKAPAVRLQSTSSSSNLWRNNKQAFSTGAQEIDKGRGGDWTDPHQPIGKSSWQMGSNQDSRKA